MSEVLNSRIDLDADDFNWIAGDAEKFVNALSGMLAGAVESHLQLLASDGIFWLMAPESREEYPIEMGPIGQLFSDLAGITMDFSLVEMIRQRVLEISQCGGLAPINYPTHREFIDRLMVLKDCVDGIIAEPSVVEYLNSKQEAG